MDTKPTLIQEFPQRVPIKIIGRGAELEPARMLELIETHLGPQCEADRIHSENQKGAYLSITFWVTLPDEGAELPLRTALQALPGVVMQL